ncbi:MAG: hypothetical protein AAFY15_08015 [Cyanobacteria bacterium J06648_11]
MASSTAIAKAEVNLDSLCTKFPQNSQCEGYTPAVDADGTTSPEGFPIVNDRDWRASVDPVRQAERIPWSRPVIVRDDFDGDYLAVIDRNFLGNFHLNGAETGVITNWSRNYIRVIVYAANTTCGFWKCASGVEYRETNKAS